MKFQKHKNYKMNTAQANQALQSIFAACENKPNTIPFDKLLLRQKISTKKYDRLLMITYIILFLSFLSPLVIVPFANQTLEWNMQEPVSMVDNYLEDGFLYLKIKGDNILYAEAYLEKLDGTVIPVFSYDEKNKLLCFPYSDDSESNIYIPVKDSKPFHLLLIPRK
ncbi:MAG: hypothetical protein ACI4HQ_07070 [Acetatifactor sp.]